MTSQDDTIVVDRAAMSAIPQLSELLAILLTQEADFQPDQARQSEGLRRIIADPGIGQILILKQGDTLIGMINLLYTISTALGGRVGILEDMIVHPDHRGGGFGSIV